LDYFLEAVIFVSSIDGWKMGRARAIFLISWFENGESTCRWKNGQTNLIGFMASSIIFNSD
jgi:hypothetical protein